MAVVITCVSAFSQSVTETRRIKTTALQMYENYKVVISGLYSKGAYTEDNFMTLFESKAVIYNDILPDNTTQQLSPLGYFEKFRANVRRIYPAFSDFEMDEPVSVGNKWHIKCRFTRGTRFRTHDDMRYPEWFFNYTLTIEMDKSYNTINKVYENARIASLGVDTPLKGFFIIENKENIPLVTKSGEPLTDWDEEYQSRIFPEDKWRIYDIKVSESINKGNLFEFAKSKFSKNKTDAIFYQPDVQLFKKDIIGAGIHCGPGFGNKMNGKNNDKFKDIEHDSYALSFSFFYGRQIAHKDKSTLFFNVGLNFNRYVHKYGGTIDTLTSQAFDSECAPYWRKIKIDSLNETVTNMSLSIPLSIQYLHQLTQQTKHPVFFSCELGLFAEVPLYSTSKYKNLTGEYRGVYGKEYFNVTMDHLYDYGRIENLNGQKDKLATTKFNGGILGGIGLWYALNNNNLLKFSISYKCSFRPPLEYKEYKDEPETLPSSNDCNNNPNTNINGNYVIFSDRNPDSYQSLLHSTNKGMQNVGFGISWVKTIGRNK